MTTREKMGAEQDDKAVKLLDLQTQIKLLIKVVEKLTERVAALERDRDSRAPGDIFVGGGSQWQ